MGDVIPRRTLKLPWFTTTRWREDRPGPPLRLTLPLHSLCHRHFLQPKTNAHSFLSRIPPIIPPTAPLDGSGCPERRDGEQRRQHRRGSGVLQGQARTPAMLVLFLKPFTTTFARAATRRERDARAGCGMHCLGHPLHSPQHAPQPGIWRQDEHQRRQGSGGGGETAFPLCGTVPPIAR